MGSCLSKNEVAKNQVAPEFDSSTDYLGSSGYIKFLSSKGGTDLCAYFWPADDTVPLKGIVQLSHGSAAYTCFDYLKFKGAGQPNVYEGSWVAALNRAGFSVCGLDAAGYGRSKGSRSLVGRMQEHVDNLLLLSDYVLENGGAAFPSGRPYFLLGHSMGGLAATLAAVQQPNRFTGLVLLAPTLSLGHMAKDGKDAKAAVKGAETEVSWIQDAWASDPYVYDGGLRSHHVDELLGTTSELCGEGGMEAVALPLLIFQSERDTRVEPDGAKQLHERATTTDKTLRMLSRQWHVLTKEEGWEELLEETVEWLSARTANNGALTRGLLSDPEQKRSSQEAPQPQQQEEEEAEGPEPGTEGAAAGGEAEAELPGAAPTELEAYGEAAEQERKSGEAATEERSDPTEGSGSTEPGEATADGEAKEEAKGDGDAGAEEEEAKEDKTASGDAAEVEEEPEAPTTVLTRSMSVLARSPEHGGLAGRGYSFSGKIAGSSASAASGLSLLAPLPPLKPRRSLGTASSDLASFGAFPSRPLTARSRLPPLDANLLLDRKPIA